MQNEVQAPPAISIFLPLTLIHWTKIKGNAASAASATDT